MALAWVCGLCAGFASLLLAHMLSHIRQVHSDDDDFRITCGISGCDKSYNKFDSFYRHVKNHHHAFLEIPATDLRHIDISTALRSQDVDFCQESCPEEWQVHYLIIYYLIPQNKIINPGGGGWGGVDVGTVSQQPTKTFYKLLF